MTNRSKIVMCVLVILSLVISIFGGAMADDSKGYALAYAGAGVMLVNTGAAVANGIALAADNPNRSNGMFGLVLGGATVGIAIVGLAASNGDDTSDEFSLALGVCGIASALTGYLNVRAANARSSAAIPGKRIAIYPSSRVNRAGAWGLVVEMNF